MTDEEAACVRGGFPIPKELAEALIANTEPLYMPDAMIENMRRQIDAYCTRPLSDAPIVVDAPPPSA